MKFFLSSGFWMGIGYLIGIGFYYFEFNFKNYFLEKPIIKNFNFMEISIILLLFISLTKLKIKEFNLKNFWASLKISFFCFFILPLLGFIFIFLLEKIKIKFKFINDFKIIIKSLIPFSPPSTSLLVYLYLLRTPIEIPIFGIFFSNIFSFIFLKYTFIELKINFFIYKIFRTFFFPLILFIIYHLIKKFLTKKIESKKFLKLINLLFLSLFSIYYGIIFLESISIFIKNKAIEILIYNGIYSFIRYFIIPFFIVRINKYLFKFNDKILPAIIFFSILRSDSISLALIKEINKTLNLNEMVAQACFIFSQNSQVLYFLSINNFKFMKKNFFIKKKK